jgi:hypothetical protein
LITSRDDPGRAFIVHDHDRLRIPPASPSRTSGAEKKNQRSTASAEPAAKPSSISSFNHDLSDARTAEDKSAESSSVNKSANVVLVSVKPVKQHFCLANVGDLKALRECPVHRFKDPPCVGIPALPDPETRKA